MPKPFEQTRRNLERRHRLDQHRRQYRSQVLGRAPLPQRRPRLAYLFAILPVIALTGLLLAAPVLARIDATISGISQPQPPNVAQVPTCEIAEEGTPTPSCEPASVIPELPTWNGTDRLNILMVGVDLREEDEIPRTDTIIIVTIDPATKTAGMVSLPRDLLVSIPGYGKDKLNAAFAYGERDKRVGGGVGLLRRTIQENFYIQVSHYATIDFRGFERVVDEFGGVTVDPPYPLLDSEYPTETLGYTSLYFPAGLQHLNGAQALRYSRTRHPDNDFGRARRQQEVILALRDQAVGQGLINNVTLVTKFLPLLDILGASVKTDLNVEQMKALANLGLGISRDSIKRYSIQDLLQDYTDENGIQYVVPGDWAKARARLREMIPNAPRILATPTPDRGVRIGVQNGTVRDRFASRTVERLKTIGYAESLVDETVPRGELPFPTTTIYVYSGDGDAALLIAQALGVPDADIRQGTGLAPNGVEILIVLGDDMPNSTPRAVTPTPTRRTR